MTIHEATRSYEAWIGRKIELYPADLRYKHGQMKVSPFLFLRATFYRWAQLFPKACPEAADAPVALAVGDLHVENFGTWRDAEGRLIWGVNDFDEAHRLPYTNDLVRLAASAMFAIGEAGWEIAPRKLCDLLLEGYTEAMEAGGKPFVLEESHKTLRLMAMSALRRPPIYWERLKGKLARVSRVPGRAVKAVESLLPEGVKARYFTLTKPKGLGSLGHRRYIALAEWDGGLIARETKELGPSSWIWARDLKENGALHVEEALQKSVRCHDPLFHVRKGWCARRLAPHCSRIDLDTLDEEHDETRLLMSMGAETANVHCGDREATPRIRRDLSRRPAKWLYEAACAMVEAVNRDWSQWRGR
jgi:hypothetical protein